MSVIQSAGGNALRIGRLAGRLLLRMRRAILHSEPESKIAEDADRFWSKSSHHQVVQDVSHWMVGKWSDPNIWRGIGERNFRMLEAAVKHANNAPPFRTIVEWGSGGGANAIRFGKEAALFVGVDISKPNLDECAKQMQKAGLSNFRPVLIRASNPEDCLQEIPEPIELFLSTAVYQHFPSKEYGIRVTRIASRLLAPSGLGMIQIRYDDATSKFKPKKQDYETNVLNFTSYRIHEFWNILNDCGLSPLYVTLETRDNLAFFFFQKRDAPRIDNSPLTPS